MRVIEKVALDAPGLIEHLAPLRSGIDGHTHLAQVERFAWHPRARFQIVHFRNRPMPVTAEQDAAAIGAHRDLAEWSAHLLRLSLLGGEAPQPKQTPVCF